jgi:phage terminase large subunit GpA-like protein
MDACLDPDVESVWFCKSAQVAGTEFAISVLGFYAHQQPCPCMFVLADEDTAKYMSKERVQRMFTDSPELSKLIVKDRFNINEITLRNDSYIAMGWASSVAKLASRPMLLIIFDEIDKPGYSVSTKEASPISLGIERTETYIDRKIIGLSTPTHEDGNIYKRLKECDIVFDWHVPCPDCGQFQPLRWSPQHCRDFKKGKYRGADGEMHDVGGVVWEGGRDATQEQISKAGYACGECGSIWTTLQKNRSVELGKIVAREEFEGKPKRVGFHVNRLYSLLAVSGNIQKLVDEWLRCQSDKKELQGFINSSLGEPWIELIGKDRNVEQILALKDERAAGVVPSWALLLVLTADIQENGIWYELRAWSLDKTSALVKYGFLMKTQELEDGMSGDFIALKDLAELSYFSATQAEYAVRFCMVDSGYRTQEVYDFCRNVPVAAPSKGQQVKKTPIGYTKIDTYPGTGKLIPGGIQLVSYDSTYWKDVLVTRLQVNVSDAGSWRLHGDVGADYGQQYTSEIKDEENGIWVQKGHQANHLWDCGVLQLVSLKILEDQGMLQRIAAAEQQKQTPQPRVQPQQQKQQMW